MVSSGRGGDPTRRCTGGLRTGVALPVLPRAPGWASGRVHLVDDPLRWSSGPDEAEVLSLPVLWWPPPHPLPGSVRAILIDGVPSEETPSIDRPVVAGVDSDILREGERADVNGSTGTLTLEGVEEVPVVTAILERADGKILLLERSSRVGTFRGRWAGVSGYLEDPTPLDQAYREIREELGLERTALELRSSGRPILARDGARIFVVHPFRFFARSTELHLDWEAVRAEWVDPTEIRRRPAVPKLDRVWEAVSGSPPGKN